jgi:hypothetical protein
MTPDRVVVSAVSIIPQDLLGEPLVEAILLRWAKIHVCGALTRRDRRFLARPRPSCSLSLLGELTTIFIALELCSVPHIVAQLLRRAETMVVSVV